MKSIHYPFLFLLFLLASTRAGFAWDIEIGARRLLPQMVTEKQDYTDSSDRKHTIKPEPKTVISGYSYHLGLRIGNVSLDMDSSEFAYKSSIAESHEAVSEETEIDCTVSENRFGLNYHLERELAGVFAGIGFSNAEEVLTSDENRWVYVTRSPYVKIGFDLIFGSLVVRYEQIYMSLGQHAVQTTSGGILIIF